MTTRSLFATQFYDALIDDPTLLAELEHSAHTLARDDKAGQAWSKVNGYPGYTSYASLNDLPQRDPAFDDLRRILDKHVRAFASEIGFELARKPRLDSLWVNLLKSGGSHSGHVHPHSFISGTFYVRTPKGSGALKLEDPRLPMMMARPTLRPDTPAERQPFVYMDPAPGTLFLWESWLRHEVVPGTTRSERISISFNYSV